MVGAARVWLWVILSSLVYVPQGMAQTSGAFPIYPQSAEVVSVNRERLIQNSEFGKALNASLAADQNALVVENEALAKDLEREELELTELRKTLEAEEFAPLAEAFDAKVKEVRRVQDQKAVDLASALENARFRFFRETERVLAEFMRENGITFVLNENAVWLSQGGDVTNLVIERLDAAYAAGDLAVE